MNRRTFLAALLSAPVVAKSNLPVLLSDTPQKVIERINCCVIENNAIKLYDDYGRLRVVVGVWT